MNEAEIFSRYLIGEIPSVELKERYFAACGKLSEANNRDARIYRMAVKRPALLPCLDAALAFSDRNALLRRKLLVMLAILETTPEYYTKFSTKDESRWKWIALFFRGCSAVFKIMAGKIILLFV
jgi:hypothetical protein